MGEGCPFSKHALNSITIVSLMQQCLSATFLSYCVLFVCLALPDYPSGQVVTFWSHKPSITHTQEEQHNILVHILYFPFKTNTLKKEERKLISIPWAITWYSSLALAVELSMPPVERRHTWGWLALVLNREDVSCLLELMAMFYGCLELVWW